MKNKKMLFGTILLLFALIGICNILNVSAIEDPEYSETIIAGHAFEVVEIFNSGEVIRIEYEISGGAEILHLYIRNSNGDVIYDYGDIEAYGLRFFYVPYNDHFRIIFKNNALLTSRHLELNVDVVKSFTITSPIYSETFLSGYNYITWTSTGDIDYVIIELYKDGSFLETIRSGINNDGEYSWYIYDDEYIDGSYYQIKIKDYYNYNTYDYSDYFTMDVESEPEPELKTITITSPTSTDTLLPGTNYITWTSTGDIDYVYIDLYKGGTFLETISTTDNDGSYTWYISSSDYIDGTNYKIRISDYYDNSIYAFSDYFSMDIEDDYVDPYKSEPENFFLGWLLFIILPAIAGIVIIAVLVRKRKRKNLGEPIT